MNSWECTKYSIIQEHFWINYQTIHTYILYSYRELRQLQYMSSEYKSCEDHSCCIYLAQRTCPRHCFGQNCFCVHCQLYSLERNQVHESCANIATFCRSVTPRNTLDQLKKEAVIFCNGTAETTVLWKTVHIETKYLLIQCDNQRLLTIVI